MLNGPPGGSKAQVSLDFDDLEKRLPPGGCYFSGGRALSQVVLDMNDVDLQSPGKVDCTRCLSAAVPLREDSSSGFRLSLPLSMFFRLGLCPTVDFSLQIILRVPALRRGVPPTPGSANPFVAQRCRWVSPFFLSALGKKPVASNVHSPDGSPDCCSVLFSVLFQVHPLFRIRDTTVYSRSSRRFFLSAILADQRESFG